jgi:hypothetical protein
MQVATKLNERYLSDCVVCVIWDQKESIYLVDHVGRGQWFPIKNLSPNESTIDVAKKLTQVSKRYALSVYVV